MIDRSGVPGKPDLIAAVAAADEEQRRVALAELDALADEVDAERLLVARHR